jgi:transcriptional regulator
MSKDEALAFAARSGIGHLTTSIDGRIESVVVPLFVDDQQDSPTIYGHLSVSNPQAVSIEGGHEALLIVDGPIAYVSPSLYPTKAETGRVVPTLNYLSVQIRGRLMPITSTEDFRNLPAALTSRFETERDEPWSLDDAPSDFIHAQMRAICGFMMRINDVTGVAKRSQNRPESDQVAVRRSFSRGTEAERQIAEWMD